MDNVTELLMQGAAGAAGGGTYIDDVFSTYLYVGNNTTNRIYNGIDLAGEGGLVWTKPRDQASGYSLYDTVRGSTKVIASNNSTYENTNNSTQELTTFNNDGFTLGSDWNTNPNSSGKKYDSWTFRKAPKFFDIVTYTGNETVREIAHNLGSVPGCIMLKNLSSTQDWIVYHIGIANNEWSTDPRRARLNLNNTNNAAYSAYGEIWGNTAFTDTHFSLGTYQNSNKNGDNYIAYIFAHNNGDGDFGDDGNKDIIKCTHYIGNSSGGQYVNLGFQPQFILTKATTGSGGGDDWYIFDAMMGLKVAAGDNPYLKPNNTDAEYAGVSEMYRVDSTGFTVDPAGTNYMNSNGRHYIVIAIRCSEGAVGKPAEAGTDVFAMDTWVSDSTPATQPNMISNFPVDFVLDRDPTYDGSWQGNWHVRGRLIQNRYLQTQSSSAEGTGTWGQFDYSNGWMNRQGLTGYTNWQSWMWKRHAGFDVVTYDGNSTPGRTVQHSLGKIPEMIWIKCRNLAEHWVVGHKGLNGGTNPWEYSLRLNHSQAETDYPYFNDTAPTSTLFTLNNNGQVNGTGTNKYIAMLFASVDGISSVGSYSPTSSSTTVTCGFQPRFVIVKAITKDNIWSVADSLRGITAGNDPCLVLNETWSNDKYGGADWIDVSSTGFTVNSAGGSGTADANSNGETYIYYAHA
tara:strand:- start:22 stop:2061 length:2040 start_codon:yes stop_codon:yes gene_type:complete